MEADRGQDVEELKRQIKERLVEGQKVAVVGVGAELRRDDFVGVRAAEEINKLNHPLLKGFAAHTAPENITGEIAEFDPALVIFVDAAELGLAPGMTRLIDWHEMGGVSFSTHTLPLQVIMDYLQQTIGCEFLMLGIQPKDTSFGTGLSPELEEFISVFGTLY